MRKKLLFLVLTLNFIWTSQAQSLINFNGFQYVIVDGHWKFKDPSCDRYYNVCSDYISVKFKPTTTSLEMRQFESLHQLNSIGGEIAGWYNYHLNFTTDDIFSFAQTLQNTSTVELVDIATFGEYHTPPPNDAQYGNQWYLENGQDRDIDVLEAWDITTGSNSVIVGVVDGGMHWGVNDLGMGTDSYQNMYLNPNVTWSNPNDPTTGTLDIDGNAYGFDFKGWHFGQDAVYWPNGNDTRSNNPHGTRVASIIAGKTNNGNGMAGIAGGWNG